MIGIEYNNPELELLVQKGKSTLYKELSGKRGFLKALHAFLQILRFISNTKDLLFYRQFDYKKDIKVSQVLINSSNIQRKLIFTEKEQGTSIIITDLTL